MKKAFTLIELLVVIAIIAILAAILFPVFAQAKEAAKATQVLSNQKQISIGCALYMTDYDDTLPSYITRLDVPRDGFYRRDIVSWPQQFDPYIKNGNPVLPPENAADPVRVPPRGLHNSPTWDESKWQKAAELPDCDGAGALAAWVPVRWIHSHYGITFPVNTRGIGWLGGSAAGTQEDPDYYWPGSYLPGTAALGTTNRNSTMSLTAVNNVARTAFITDGFTGVIRTGGFGTTTGCESASMYKGGGNVGFLDSHVKFVKGNNQRYLSQDDAGRWYMTYYTIDR